MTYHYVYSYGWSLLWLLVIVALCLYVIVRLKSDARSKSVQKRAALIARADDQHAQWMSGDDRGFYGQYPPADLSD